MEWSVRKRAGKIFLDHNQNVRGKNMASIFSLRPLPHAPRVDASEVGRAGLGVPHRLHHRDRARPAGRRRRPVADILRSKHDLTRLLDAG